jgi:fructokinase
MIYVCGEALYDVHVRCAQSRGFVLDAVAAGSPLNLAIGLARLQQPVAFIGSLAAGTLGDKLAETLAGEGVNVERVERVDGPSTLVLVQRDEHDSPTYTFSQHAGAETHALTSRQMDLPGAQALHVGSYPCVVEPSGASIRALVDTVHAEGRAVIGMDLNVRLRAQPDLDRWRDHLHWFTERGTVVKASLEDLQLLYGDVDIAEVVKGWLARSVSLAVVTLGDRGALAFFGEHVVEVPACRVDAVDTVGAGDAFQAALLAHLRMLGLLTRERLKAPPYRALAEALCVAANAAAITVGRLGADPPRHAELYL